MAKNKKISIKDFQKALTFNDFNKLKELFKSPGLTELYENQTSNSFKLNSHYPRDAWLNIYNKNGEHLLWAWENDPFLSKMKNIFEHERIWLGLLEMNNYGNTKNLWSIIKIAPQKYQNFDAFDLYQHLPKDLKFGFSNYHFDSFVNNFLNKNGFSFFIINDMFTELRSLKLYEFLKTKDDPFNYYNQTAVPYNFRKSLFFNPTLIDNIKKVPVSDLFTCIVFLNYVQHPIYNNALNRLETIYSKFYPDLENDIKSATFLLNNVFTEKNINLDLNNDSLNIEDYVELINKIKDISIGITQSKIININPDLSDLDFSM